MPVAYTESMTQEATYWPPGVPDGFGGQDFSGSMPVRIKCRWQDDAVIFRDAQGREVTSSSIVYVDRDVAVRGFLVLGDHTTELPHRVAGAFEIRQVGKSPSLSESETLYKAFL